MERLARRWNADSVGPRSELAAPDKGSRRRARSTAKRGDLVTEEASAYRRRRVPPIVFASRPRFIATRAISRRNPALHGRQVNSE